MFASVCLFKLANVRASQVETVKNGFVVSLAFRKKILRKIKGFLSFELEHYFI